MSRSRPGLEWAVDQTTHPLHHDAASDIRTGKRDHRVSGERAYLLARGGRGKEWQESHYRA